MRELYGAETRPDPGGERRSDTAGHRLARAFTDAAHADRSTWAGLAEPVGTVGSDPEDVAALTPGSTATPAVDDVVAPAAAPAADPDAEPPEGVWSRLGGAAFDPGRPGLRALAVVAVVVVLGAAVLAWWSRPRPEPLVPQLANPTAVAPSPTIPAELVVAVTGRVRQPGLVYLPPGARVADAIEAAGGLLPDAEADHLNLARKVSDGELIAVGVDPPPGEPAAGAGPGTGGKVNLNTATLVELQALPGIGPALAQRIIDYRAAYGPFASVEQLRQVSGIGEVRFAELRELVTV